MAPRVPLDIARQAKAKAMLRGQSLGKYITELIENDLNYRCHFEEIESVECAICRDARNQTKEKETANG